MKKMFLFAVIVLLLTVSVSFSSGPKHHKTDLPDPKQYNAHFGDMDSNGDELVNWDEFKKHFPQAEMNVFKATDLNADGDITHEEWHQFKEAHGLKDNH